MDWTVLPNPLAAAAGIVAQAAGGGGDALITSLLSGLGASGLSTGILWKIHQDSEKRHEVVEDDMRQRHLTERAEDRKTIRELTSRLFLLADRGMEVGQTAQEVVKGDTHDPRLLLLLERLEAELDQRSGS